MTTKETLTNLIKSCIPIIWIETVQDYQETRILEEVAKERNRTIKRWSITNQFNAEQLPNRMYEPDPVSFLNSVIESKEENVMFVAEDFSPFIENDPVCQRRFRDCYKALAPTTNSLIIINPTIPNFPAGMDKEIYVVEGELPSQPEIEEIINGFLQSIPPTSREEVTPTIIEEMSGSLMGLTITEIRSALARNIVQYKKISIETPLYLNEEFEQILKKEGILEYMRSDTTMADIGGLENLKSYLQKRKKGFSKRARELKLPEPKGILLMGLPGTAKSATAKAVSRDWNFKLIKLNVGDLFGGIVGESEKNVKRVITRLNKMGRCILFLDEIDKGFSGTKGSGDNDSGVTRRVFGSFLTWLQEKKGKIYVIMTANGITNLPPELMRKGRLDEIFFVNLPNAVERKAIFAIHMLKYTSTIANFNLDILVFNSEGFSGSEIQEAVISGNYDAFFEDVEPTTNHFLNAIKTTNPLSVTCKEDLNTLRNWAKSRAVDASLPEVKDKNRVMIEV